VTPDHTHLGQLYEVHDWLREQLSMLRQGLGTASFLAQCRTFCSVLSAHHSDEDDNLFPALAAEHPALADVLATLRRDHEQVAEILRAIDALTRQGPPPDVAGELETLAAVLESHLTYEERQLAGLQARINLTHVLPDPQDL
jgi:iron-sulfur cluster repair protein YtfE (RIC family)